MHFARTDNTETDKRNKAKKTTGQSEVSSCRKLLKNKETKRMENRVWDKQLAAGSDANTTEDDLISLVSSQHDKYTLYWWYKNRM